MIEIIIPVGLPASGKTNWAIEYINKNPDTVRVCRDDFRKMLFGKYHNFPFGDKRYEDFVTELEHDAIDTAITRGYNVIVDATNLRDPHKFNYFTNNPSNIEVKTRIEDSFLSVPVEECIKRDKNRENGVGENVIRGMYNKYINEG